MLEEYRVCVAAAALWAHSAWKLWTQRCVCRALFAADGLHAAQLFVSLSSIEARGCGLTQVPVCLTQMNAALCTSWLTRPASYLSSNALLFGE